MSSSIFCMSLFLFTVNLECLRSCWCMVFCLLWRYLQHSRCQKWPRSDTDIFCRTCEKWSTSKESLLHAQQWYCWTSASSVRGYRLLLWAEAGVQSGASWALTEGWGKPEVPHSGASWRTKEMPVHYVEGWTLWFLSGAVPAYQSCPGSQSCSGFPLLALHFCCGCPFQKSSTSAQTRFPKAWSCNRRSSIRARGNWGHPAAARTSH